MKNKEKNSISRGFKGISIPNRIWIDPSLDIQEKFFLAEVDSLDKSDEGGRGCFAHNSWFEMLFRVSEKTVKRILSSLEEKGYISRESVENNGNNKRILKSRLKIKNYDVETSGRFLQKEFWFCDLGIQEKAFVAEALFHKKGPNPYGKEAAHFESLFQLSRARTSSILSELCRSRMLMKTASSKFIPHPFFHFYFKSLALCEALNETIQKYWGGCLGREGLSEIEDTLDGLMEKAHPGLDKIEAMYKKTGLCQGCIVSDPTLFGSDPTLFIFDPTFTEPRPSSVFKSDPTSFIFDPTLFISDPTLFRLDPTLFIFDPHDNITIDNNMIIISITRIIYYYLCAKFFKKNKKGIFKLIFGFEMHDGEGLQITNTIPDNTGQGGGGSLIAEQKELSKGRNPVRVERLRRLAGHFKASRGKVVLEEAEHPIPKPEPKLAKEETKESDAYLLAREIIHFFQKFEKFKKHEKTILKESREVEALILGSRKEVITLRRNVQGYFRKRELFERMKGGKNEADYFVKQYGRKKFLDAVLELGEDYTENTVETVGRGEGSIIERTLERLKNRDKKLGIEEFKSIVVESMQNTSSPQEKALLYRKLKEMKRGYFLPSQDYTKIPSQLSCLEETLAGLFGDSEYREAIFDLGGFEKYLAGMNIKLKMGLDTILYLDQINRSVNRGRMLFVTGQSQIASNEVEKLWILTSLFYSWRKGVSFSNIKKLSIYQVQDSFRALYQKGASIPTGTPEFDKIGECLITGLNGADEFVKHYGAEYNIPYEIYKNLSKQYSESRGGGIFIGCDESIEKMPENVKGEFDSICLDIKKIPEIILETKKEQAQTSTTVFPSNKGEKEANNEYVKIGLDQKKKLDIFWKKCLDSNKIEFEDTNPIRLFQFLKNYKGLSVPSSEIQKALDSQRDFLIQMGLEEACLFAKALSHPAGFQFYQGLFQEFSALKGGMGVYGTNLFDDYALSEALKLVIEKYFVELCSNSLKMEKLY